MDVPMFALVAGHRLAERGRAALRALDVLRYWEVGGDRLRLSREEDERLWKRSERLLFSFALSLLGTAAGVVVLGFYFSVWHGVAGCVAVAAGFFLLWKTA
jgi:hypothetical protein